MSSPENIGKVGEKRVARKLDWLSKEYIILNDIMLPTQYETTQIDHIVISPYGIFVIETKNLRDGFLAMKTLKNGNKVYSERRGGMDGQANNINLEILSVKISPIQGQ